MDRLLYIPFYLSHNYFGCHNRHVSLTPTGVQTIPASFLFPFFLSFSAGFKIAYYQKYVQGWALVVYACNTSYFGVWYQEDLSSRPVWENSLQNPIFKIIRAKWTEGGLK
jgi:uncharacterized membrane protein